MTLDGHADTVTSLICWEGYLLSGSLDRTIKAWALNEGGHLEAIYTHIEEHVSYSSTTILKLYIYAHLLLGPHFFFCSWFLIVVEVCYIDLFLRTQFLCIRVLLLSAG
jgi:WD40 repeat protein